MMKTMVTRTLFIFIGMSAVYIHTNAATISWPRPQDIDKKTTDQVTRMYIKEIRAAVNRRKAKHEALQTLTQMINEANSTCKAQPVTYSKEFEMKQKMACERADKMQKIKNAIQSALHDIPTTRLGQPEPEYE